MYIKFKAQYYDIPYFLRVGDPKHYLTSCPASHERMYTVSELFSDNTCSNRSHARVKISNLMIRRTDASQLYTQNAGLIRNSLNHIAGRAAWNMLFLYSYHTCRTLGTYRLGCSLLTAHALLTAHCSLQCSLLFHGLLGHPLGSRCGFLTELNLEHM